MLFENYNKLFTVDRCNNLSEHNEAVEDGYNIQDEEISILRTQIDKLVEKLKEEGVSTNFTNSGGIVFVKTNLVDFNEDEESFEEEYSNPFPGCDDFHKNWESILKAFNQYKNRYSYENMINAKMNMNPYYDDVDTEYNKDPRELGYEYAKNNNIKTWKDYVTNESVSFRFHFWKGIQDYLNFKEYHEKFYGI